MSTFKKFTSNDIIVTPFTVNKQFTQNTIPASSTTGAVIISGSNESYPLGGGEIGTGSKSLVYNSIKQLYYSNYLSGSNGNSSNSSTASFNPDGTISGPFYTTNYLNSIQSLTEDRYFPTLAGSNITVLSIPSKQFGEYIKPGSYSSSLAVDDGQGNLISNSLNVGNIIYDAGLAIFTGENGSGGNYDFTGSKWESTLTIYETQYKCTIRANELNYSLNPSLTTTYGSDSIIISGSSTYKDFVTGSDFSPYVTTVGLYDEEQNLLAVAKLGQPLPTSQTTDTTILINIDR